MVWMGKQCVLMLVVFASIGPAYGSDLLQAVRDKDYDLAATLLAREHANADERGPNGDTSVLVAARKGHLEMVRLLVKHGAKINTLDSKRRDILNIAISTKNPPLARLALELGADATMVTSIYDGAAIIYGSAKGAVEIVDMLISAGAPVNRVNNVGWTALLEVAILGDGSEAYVKIAQMLLAAGADKNISDRNGVTPLEHAEQRGQRNLVEVLND